jgi:hypothetical protein
VTSGSNGSCGGTYLCTAGTGYDSPTGLGTPNGTGAVQAVLVGLAPELVAPRDRDTAQGLLNFMIFLGGGIGPAAVAGLSGIVPVPVALAVLAALPLAGFVLSLTLRPGASRSTASP